MRRQSQVLGRADVLKALAGMSVVGASALAAANVAEAAGGVSKANAKYQDHPSGGHMCGNCTYFLKSQHACKIVAGPIAATAWCTLFAPVPR